MSKAAFVCVCVYVQRAFTDSNFTDFKGTRPHRHAVSRQRGGKVFFSFSTKIEHSCITIHTQAQGSTQLQEEREASVSVEA